MAGADLCRAAVGCARTGRSPGNAAFVSLSAGRGEFPAEALQWQGSEGGFRVQGSGFRMVKIGRKVRDSDKGNEPLCRGFFRARSWHAGAGAADQLGQVVAVSLGRGSDGAAVAVARGGRRGAAFAGRGQRPISGPRARGLERPVSARAVGKAGFRAHAAGFVRRGGAGIDRQGGGRWPVCREWC